MSTSAAARAILLAALAPKARVCGYFKYGLLAAAFLPACYAGTAHDASPRRIAADPTWQIVRGVPFVAQDGSHDCGAAALAMVLSYWRAPVPAAELRALAPPGDSGIGAARLRDVARGKGLEAFVVAGTLTDLVDQVARGRPVVVGLAKPMRGTGGRAAAHYEVVTGINRQRRLVLTLDPARGPRENTFEGFAREWIPAGQVTLIVFPGGARAPV
jgi:ABC-type bacteriocin/lantibiotic exporter with double-glycine peptidase domain